MASIASVKAEISNRATRVKVGTHRIISGRGSADRFSSFPFVSGDTFRCLADYYLETDSSASRVQQRLYDSKSASSALFCEVSRIDDLCKLAIDNDLRNVTVLIHNGDVIPVGTVTELKGKVKRIFCVNWMGDRGIAEPLPIGIENAHWNINGRLEDLVQNFPENLDGFLSKHRPISCFQSFRIQTNPVERENVAPIFSSIIDSLTFNKKISHSNFMRQIGRSKFVISPPGNGPDCHRTWESMYMGAIPVVLGTSWPFSHLNLPVLVVENWDEAREILDTGVEDRYQEIWQKTDRSQMYFPAFERQIWGE